MWLHFILFYSYSTSYVVRHYFGSVTSINALITCLHEINFPHNHVHLALKSCKIFSNYVIVIEIHIVQQHMI